MIKPLKTCDYNSAYEAAFYKTSSYQAHGQLIFLPVKPPIRRIPILGQKLTLLNDIKLRKRISFYDYSQIKQF